MDFRRHVGSGLMAAALAALLMLAAAPAFAQSVPRAAPTTPVWTVPAAMGSGSNAQPQQTARPRYAVMEDDAPSALPLRTDPTITQPAAPEAPTVSPPHYSVMAPPRPVSSGLAPRNATRHAAAGMGQAYRLGTGDKLRITVYGEPDLSGEFEVDSSGDVRLPLIGQVHAAGRTVHGFEDRVTTKLAAGYLRNPQVSAEVTAYRPFFIIGEVNKPGQYPYVNDMNVVTAVALAGGFTYRADESDVYVRRDGSTKEVEEPADETTRIHPGDIIRVDERFF